MTDLREGTAVPCPYKKRRGIVNVTDPREGTAVPCPYKKRRGMALPCPVGLNDQSQLPPKLVLVSVKFLERVLGQFRDYATAEGFIKTLQATVTLAPELYLN